MALKSGFANKEALSGILVERAIVPNTLSAAGTVNTYSASPQPAAGIDSWKAGACRFRNLVIVCDVASVSTTGSLALTLRDSGSAITTANGAASTQLAVTLSDITEAGLYTAELRLTHVFAATTARVIAAANNDEVRRYLSLRAAATDADFVFAAWFIFANNFGDFPVQDATALTATWNAA